MTTPKQIAPFLLTVLLFIQALTAHSQVSGCKDPAATNYNPAATINDGSCTYSSTFYTPPVKVDPINSVLIETSGLQMAGNFLWSFNDGGNAAAIYRIDTTSDAILQTINLDATTNIDWEDIAFDGTHFYIGDFGNNANGARTDLKIYKFPLSAIADYISNPVTTVSSANIEVINFTYADQVPVTPTSANATKWDCEAMIVDAGKIHLFSKNWIDINTTHYVINGITGGSYVAAPLETLATNYLVTGADKVPANNIVALLGYQTSGFGNHFMHLLSDFSSGFYFNGNKRRIDLPNAISMGQAEGICFRNSTYGYISNERVTSPITVTQKLRSFNTESFVPAYVLPTDLLKFNAINTNDEHQISWSFASPVKQLRILQGSNQSTFTEIREYATSTSGSIYLQPTTKQSCYKLVWTQPGGGSKFSNVVCLNSEVKKGIQKIVLRNNGELSFLFTDNVAGKYLFRLINADGKLIAQTERNVISGVNTMYFAKSVNRGSLVFLQAISTSEQKSFLLKVE